MRPWRQRDARAVEAHDTLAFDRLTAELEAGLDAIDFDEVTLDDRRLFVEQAVVWQVRCALRAGRFDLALALHRHGVERLARLERDALRFVPRLVRGERRERA